MVSPVIKQHLDVLTQAAVLLRINELSFSSYSASTNQLSEEVLSTKLSFNRLLGAEDEMEYHLVSARHEQLLAEKWRTNMEREEEIGESITALEPRQLLKKAKEYHIELDALLVLGTFYPML
ncbi:hypothetical protein L208DRAFT_438433 [Tricholoma matsutake]|nr:hypothetical protein L208DRAFT_438433 [Tricholoma matsutake 945]